MLKQILIGSILLTGSANADIFQALKDAANKAVEVQNRLKNPNEESMASADQSSPPQFNSLAEEAAYKKRQEDKKSTDAQKYEQELKNSIIPRIERLRTSEAGFYQKYLVRQTDKQEMIDDKFKNRTQLYNSMQKDFAILDAEREKLYNILDDNKFNNLSDVQSKVLNEYFKDSNWYSALWSVFSNVPLSYSDGYVLSCFNRGSVENNNEEIHVDLRNTRENFKSAYDYQQYLKCSYLTFQQRQDERVAEVKREQLQKNQQAKSLNEQKERQKVQGACQAWRVKANRGVYSLGVGDQVMTSKGGIFVIQGVNANTFLVNTMFGPMYLQKSDLIPYSSAKTAPSEYCYR